MATSYDIDLIINILREQAVTLKEKTQGTRNGTSTGNTASASGAGAAHNKQSEENLVVINEINTRILNLYQPKMVNRMNESPDYYEKSFPTLFKAQSLSPPIEYSGETNSKEIRNKKEDIKKNVTVSLMEQSRREGEIDEEEEEENDISSSSSDDILLDRPLDKDALSLDDMNITTNDQISVLSKSTQNHTTASIDTIDNTNNSVEPDSSRTSLSIASSKIPLPRRSSSLRRGSDNSSKSKSKPLDPKRKGSTTSSIDSSSSSSSPSGSNANKQQSASTTKKQNQGIFNLTRLIRPVVRHSNTHGGESRRTQTIQEESEEDLANSPNVSGNITNNFRFKNARRERKERISSDDSSDDDSDLTSINRSLNRTRQSSATVSTIDISHENTTMEDTNGAVDDGEDDDDDDDDDFGDDDLLDSDSDFNVANSDSLNPMDSSSFIHNTFASDQSSDLNYEDETLDSDSFSEDSDYIPGEVDESLDDGSNSASLLYKQSALKNTDLPSVSKISFRSRANTTGSNRYAKYHNTNSFLSSPPNNLLNRRKPPPSAIQNGVSISKTMQLKTMSKSTSNMLSLLSNNSEANEPNKKLFDESIVKRDLTNVKLDHRDQKSKLSALIDSINNPLSYFENIGYQSTGKKSRRFARGRSMTDLHGLPSSLNGRNENDFVEVSIILSKVNNERPIYLKLLKSAKVIDLIGLTLLTLQKYDASKVTDDSMTLKFDPSKIVFDPNYWGLYLSDDGELMDDFGKLDRTRQIMAYGTDEFAMVECSEEEAKFNEKITPIITSASQLSDRSVLDRPVPSTTNANPISNSNLNYQLDVSGISKSAKRTSAIQQTGTLGTLKTLGAEIRHTLQAADLTPVNSMNKTNEITPGFDVMHTKDGKRVHKTNNYAFDSDESDEEDQVTSDVHPNRGHISDKVSSSLANTGDRASRTHLSRRQSLSQLAKPNIDNASSKLNKLMNNMNNKTLSTLWHNAINDNMVNSNNNMDEAAALFSASNKYHRWTVWRRQQVAFKNRIERSLAVDGNEIYILPYSENRDSWNNKDNAKTKTTRFHVSQIKKCKQSSKAPYHFKIYVNKSTGLKKYYLEASNASQCQEIVMTIQLLMKTYRAETRSRQT